MPDRLSYKFRIYPSRSQTRKLASALDLCRELYNSALQERRDAWKLNRINISQQDQEKQLPAIKQIRDDLISVHSQVLQDVLKRVDRSFQNFFHRVKRGEKPGFPRFQAQSRYNSFTFKQSGFNLEKDKLNLSKIGKIKIKLHREMIGRIKTLTISRDSCGKWYACFAVETVRESIEPLNNAVGIDCGIKTFAMLSDGRRIENPRFFANDEKLLAGAQRRLSKQPKGSKERDKKRRIVAKFLGLEKSLGTIEKRKAADLVLLEANPLENIANTKKIFAVIAGGRYLTNETLQKMLTDVEAITDKK